MKCITKISILTVFFCILFVFNATQNLCAQDDPTAEFSNFKFSIDFCRFRYSEAQTYVEYYASMYRKHLTYLPEEDHFRSEFITTAQVFDKDSLVASKSWKSVNIADSLTEILSGQRLFCINDFILANGNYSMTLKIQDGNNPDTATEYTFPLSLPGFNNTDLQISDIQMGSLIQRDTSNSYMVKNGFRVTPNPSGIYGIGMPMLYMYSEIYNLAPATRDSGNYYRTTYKIFDADGNLMKEMPPRIRQKPGTSAVEVSGINVVTLVSGVYSVVLEVIDQGKNQSATAMRKFFVYREADYAEGGAAFQRREQLKAEGSPGLDADRYDMMTEKEMDQEFEYTRHISNKEERNTYKKLNLEGKRTFIKEFWANRDPSPGTKENEFKRDYLARVAYANQTFKGGFRSGWRSDRGRILLIYGGPDEIERFPFSNQNRTYEIWNYFSQQGGIRFYFVDKRDTGDMELVHSTARGELYDPEWERWIDPNR